MSLTLSPSPAGTVMPDSATSLMRALSILELIAQRAGGSDERSRSAER